VDRLLALLALATFTAFLAVIVGFVPDPDMIIIFGFVVLLVIYDFWETIRPQRRPPGD
jgi:hypothetical protein